MNTDTPETIGGTTNLMTRGSYTSFRDFYYGDNSAGSGDIGTIYSDWVHLDEGEKYYYTSELN